MLSAVLFNAANFKCNFIEKGKKPVVVDLAVLEIKPNCLTQLHVNSERDQILTICKDCSKDAGLLHGITNGTLCSEGFSSSSYLLFNMKYETCVMSYL